LAFTFNAGTLKDPLYRSRSLCGDGECDGGPAHLDFEAIGLPLWVPLKPHGWEAWQRDKVPESACEKCTTNHAAAERAFAGRTFEIDGAPVTPPSHPSDGVPVEEKELSRFVSLDHALHMQLLYRASHGESGTFGLRQNNGLTVRATL
jgi:hypothetical protein